MEHIDKTIDYYEVNAISFTEHTRDVPFEETQNKFMNLIPQGGTILDFGCGAGRDTKLFLSKGYNVEAIDGSPKLCKLTSEYTGIKVKNMLFSDLNEKEKYDGIWACASILHLPKNELKDVLKKMLIALKPGGYIYSGFKYGEFEGLRGSGRYFTDFTEESFEGFLEDIPEAKLVDMWRTNDVRPGREDEQWLNVIVTRMS